MELELLAKHILAELGEQRLAAAISRRRCEEITVYL